MKKKLLTIAVLMATSTSFAGGKHFHPKQIVKCSGECTQEQIKGAVPAAISYLNKQAKIDKVWAEAKIDNLEKKKFSKGPEWVVTLLDSKEQKRFVFMTLDGYVTGSNSTGE